MNDRERNALRALEAIMTSTPLRHECENCGDAAMAPTHELPVGWKYLAATDKLFDSLDEVDNKTLLICAICYGLATRVIKKLPL